MFESLAYEKSGGGRDGIGDSVCMDVGPYEIYYCKATCVFQQKIQTTVWRYTRQYFTVRECGSICTTG